MCSQEEMNRLLVQSSAVPEHKGLPAHHKFTKGRLSEKYNARVLSRGNTTVDNLLDKLCGLCRAWRRGAEAAALSALPG